MAKRVVWLLFLFSSPRLIAKHPIESMSVGDARLSQGKIHVKIKVLEEGLLQSLRNYGKKHVAFDYDQAQFDQETLKLTSSYVRNHLSFVANGQVLSFRWGSLKWVESTKDSDHAVLVVEVFFDLGKIKEIKSLEIKDSLLFDAVKTQSNLLNIHFPVEAFQTMRFKEGAESAKLDFRN